jgi:hypothetical protein
MGTDKTKKNLRIDESGQGFKPSTSQTCVGSKELYLYACHFKQKKRKALPVHTMKKQAGDWRCDSTHSYRPPHMKVYNPEHSTPGKTSCHYVSNMTLGGPQLWQREVC